MITDVTQLRQTVASAHITTTKWTSIQQQLRSQGASLKDLDEPSKKPLMEMRESITRDVELMLRLCKELEGARKGWWNGKAGQRKEWLERGDEEKMTKINKINNSIIDILRDIQQKLGQFCRYTLDVSAASLLPEEEGEEKETADREYDLVYA